MSDKGWKEAAVRDAETRRWGGYGYGFGKEMDERRESQDLRGYDGRKGERRRQGEQPTKRRRPEPEQRSAKGLGLRGREGEKAKEN